MSRIILMLFLASLFACKGGTTSTEQTKSEVYIYDYNANNCRTFKHEYLSRKEYCTGLQMEWNNGCANDDRRQEFNAFCQELEWNPEATNKAWNKVKPSIMCYVSKIHPTDEDIIAGRNYINTQGTQNSSVSVYHESFKLIAKKEIQEGNFKITMQLVDLKTKKVIDEKFRVWPYNDARSLSLDSDTEDASTICYAKIW